MECLPNVTYVYEYLIFLGQVKWVRTEGKLNNRDDHPLKLIFWYDKVFWIWIWMMMHRAPMQVHDMHIDIFDR